MNATATTAELIVLAPGRDVEAADAAFFANPRYPATRFRGRRAVVRTMNDIFARLRRGARIGLHLGCGQQRIPEMINCDLYSDHADMKLDAVDLAGIPSGSIDLIEHHHMIEHLSFQQADLAIAEWARVLRPGGMLLFTCPNLDQVARKWILDKYACPIRHFVKKYVLFRKVGPYVDPRYDWTVCMIFGSQEHEGMFHKSGYDPKRLARLLAPHGIVVEYALSSFWQQSTPSLLVIARKVPKTPGV